MNKKKIINDPVYGFISIPSGFIFDLIQHPYFQRLRYIKQVSMTHLVYPGALHTRFQHALGAMHLMALALETLRGKGIAISAEEEEAALAAILLHDIGHGPFSHSLEHTLVEGVSHELLSSLMMDELNEATMGRLDLAIEIFNNRYPRRFLYQLVAGQLDIDRMDYLSRDSFFTGVAEGVISFDRIIKMLNVIDNELVVEQKGIYSVEKFLIARRLMYWQVYLHKTVISAEQMLLKILQRAKELYGAGHSLFATPALEHFLRNKVTRQNFTEDALHLVHFSQLDDTDIWSAVKTWAHHSDRILQRLCSRLIARSLYHTELHAVLPEEGQLVQLRAEAVNYFDIDVADVDYYVWVQSIENSAYEPNNGTIRILMKDGSIQDIAEASDLSNLETLSRKVQKFAVSFPKELVHTPLSMH
ncbi:MAG TPA: HD domain-containing protein [Parapedobacter sp.]|uniref:HD domain-containing protein n=1 Tax=Parapedobacter sp. TaxID=1958893 RepID=UPI002C8F3DD3|nr:HD domain-containing protein [Parapedobacter sp.]HWK56879.1 HD domain-containing protein [Parapedobacter sp.]